MTKRRAVSDFVDNTNLRVALIRPLLDGAKIQLKRYIKAQAYCKHDPIGGANQSLFELSNLFENLATVVIYLELCNIYQPDGQLFKDIRDHIRHDVREELDKEETRKANRAKRLGLNPNLQMSIGFLDDAVQVGNIKIENKQIANYLQTADTAISSLAVSQK